MSNYKKNNINLLSSSSKVEVSDSYYENLKIEAYPNYKDYIYSPPPRNVNRWVEAVKDIYYREKNGVNKSKAIKMSINNWEESEQREFLNWLKFYEEGAHLKYKYAQKWYEGDEPGYFLPVKHSPETSLQDENEASDLHELSALQKKKIIDQQRKKIISRLDSAEKILRSEEGELFAGKEFETLLEIIYQLKKKIQLINKKSTSTKLYDDIIVREANVLKKQGFDKAADVLFKLADVPATPAPPPPIMPQGAPTTIPGGQIGAAPPGNNPPNLVEDVQPSEGMKKFLDNLKGGNITEVNDSDDLEITDSDNLEVDDSNNSYLIVEAQAAPQEGSAQAPAAAPQPEAPAGPAKSIENKVDNSKSVETREFDAVINEAFKNLKVEDIVFKLEDLAKIFKTREVPRQLAIVDMMLDTLGLSTFFPSLAEATNKSLESNQYVLTRIEDILSKLRGTMATNKIDLSNENAAALSPEVQAIKGKLSEQEEKEKARKKMKKELSEQALDGAMKESPDVEMKEDLSQPAQVESAPPAAAPPAAAPAPAAPAPAK